MIERDGERERARDEKESYGEGGMKREKEGKGGRERCIEAERRIETHRYRV